MRTTLPKARLRSSPASGELFEKCSGDSQQLDNPDELGVPSLRGSVHLGRFANTDEVYAPFAAFGLVRDEKARSSANALVVNQHAGTLNRLLQWGECARQTMSSGSYGGGLTRPVSFAWVGNIHPEIGVPMDRGDIGSHTGATKERLFIYTARPVPPHSEIPPEYDLPADHERWIWAELDDDMAELLGMGSLLGDPEAAERSELARPEQGAEALRANAEDYRPDETGYDFTLPDGVRSRLRYRRDGDKWNAEFRVGNRAIELPAEHSLKEAAARVLNCFSSSGKTITLSAEAKKLMASLSTFASVKASIAVEEGRTTETARWGIATWKVSVLSGLIFAFDHLAGQTSEEGDAAGGMVLSRRQLARAKALLAVLDGCRDRWMDCTASAQTKSVFRASQQTADFLAGIPEDAVPADLPSGMQEPPGGPQRKRPRTGDDRGPDDDHMHQESEQEGAPGQLLEGAQPQVLDDRLVDADLTPRLEAKLLSEGVPITRGYGPQGASVQIFKQGQGAAWKSDREIVQYTAMRGKTEVKCAEVCQNLRRNVQFGEKTKRLALPQEVWEQVMRAGLGQHPIGRLVDIGTRTSRVVWDTPPTPAEGRDAMVVWHNHLVDLCGVTGRDMRKFMAKGAAQPEGPGAAGVA